MLKAFQVFFSCRECESSVIFYMCMWVRYLQNFPNVYHAWSYSVSTGMHSLTRCHCRCRLACIVLPVMVSTCMHSYTLFGLACIDLPDADFQTAEGTSVLSRELPISNTISTVDIMKRIFWTESSPIWDIRQHDSDAYKNQSVDLHGMYCALALKSDNTIMHVRNFEVKRRRLTRSCLHRLWTQL